MLLGRKQDMNHVYEEAHLINLFSPFLFPVQNCDTFVPLRVLNSLLSLTQNMLKKKEKEKKIMCNIRKKEKEKMSSLSLMIITSLTSMRLSLTFMHDCSISTERMKRTKIARTNCNHFFTNSPANHTFRSGESHDIVETVSTLREMRRTKKCTFLCTWNKRAKTVRNLLRCHAHQVHITTRTRASSYHAKPCVYLVQRGGKATPKGKRRVSIVMKLH